MAAALAVGCLTLAVGSATSDAFTTPFGLEVSDTVDRGLGWIRAQEEGGLWTDAQGSRAGGLVMLCVLEKRASADWNAPTNGYVGSSPADQAILRRAAAALIANDAALRNAGPPDAYGTGGALMGLALYLATGGPDEVGAEIGVGEAVANGAQALRQNQGQGDCNRGGWNYDVPGEVGDLSTTQFAMAGLSAASSHWPPASETLPTATSFIDDTQLDDGGHVYQGCTVEARHSMTASGLWSYRLASVQATDERAQRALGWLDRSWQYEENIVGAYFYYMWAVAKALEVSTDPGVEGIFEDDIGGGREMAGLGYPEEPDAWYSDLAYTIVNRQQPDGAWLAHESVVADTAFALLMLERSLGGVCGDEQNDQDGWCDGDDNCPLSRNPDQSDRDDDRVGDVCDNCPDHLNRDQSDADGDGAGDPCDLYFCVADGPEICDGIDNDCDTQIDDDPEGEGDVCDTGLAGVCSVGRQVCRGEAGLECVRIIEPDAQPEICNLADDDCDGEVDEALIRTCYDGPDETIDVGPCRAGEQTCVQGEFGLCVDQVVPADELCDGADNDCNGAIDDDPAGVGIFCQTGLSGICGVGTMACAGAEGLGCVPNVAPGARAETCDGFDEDCDGQRDEDVERPCYDGPPETRQIGTCREGRQICDRGLWVACAGQTLPRGELCDGLDNDCDDAIDEEAFGAGAACETQLPGVCNAGIMQCHGPDGLQCDPVVPPGAQIEICNQLDDDCDGQIDEDLTRSCYRGPDGTLGVGVCAAGLEACRNGAWSQCEGDQGPSIEVCDGRDNDCDTETDNGAAGEGLPCITGLPGICGPGAFRCAGDAGMQCEPAVQPGERAEICDGNDDDCDGEIDEALVQSCYDGPDGTVGVGPCVSGQQRCVEATWSECEGQILPAGEACDGLDSDCNGEVDDQVPGSGEPCSTGLDGVCGIGQRLCRGVDGMVCTAAVAPNQRPERCNNEDDDCDGEIDEAVVQNCYEGPPQTLDVGECAAGRQTCVAGAWGACREQVRPTDEQCDGADNDCNGVIDDEIIGDAHPCRTELPGACAAGHQACAGQAGIICVADLAPEPEICNGLDDNCDGQIDEALSRPCYEAPPETQDVGLCATGQQTCAAGAWGPCIDSVGPRPEACDDLDNDCDGQIDETLTEACYTGPEGTVDIGHCRAGTHTCHEGRWDACQGARLPAEELCDGTDNDCDGQIDEDDPGLSAQCDTGRPGQCTDGLRLCRDGALICVSQLEPSLEACDGLDNDCDGEVDEDSFGDGSACATGMSGQCAAGDWMCVDGRLICSARHVPADEICDRADNDCDGRIDDGLRNACGECQAPLPEICNGIDDDCDAQIDEEAECEFEDLVCAFGECVLFCGAGAGDCPGQQICVDDACVERCDLMDCPANHVCRQGECVDLCIDVSCDGDEICFNGDCVAPDCHEIGCPDGQICDGAECQPDLCDGVQCDAGHFCRDGVCVPSCATQSCRLLESCVDGDCVPDPCGGLVCGEREICEEGVCVPDPCVETECHATQRCEGGECRLDPCEPIVCPPSERCEMVGGLAQCVADWTAIDDIDPDPDPDAGVPARDRDAGWDSGGSDEAETGPAPPPDTGRADVAPDSFPGDGGAIDGLTSDVAHESEPVPVGCTCRLADDGPDGWVPLALCLAWLGWRRRARLSGRPT